MRECKEAGSDVPLVCMSEEDASVITEFIAKSIRYHRLVNNCPGIEVVDGL